MSLPLNKRDYDLFLSYAHSDRAFVESLYQWLRQSAGLQVWWDDRDMSAGALLATDLQKAIERCRAVLLVASDESLARGWVQAEYNAAMDERANHNGFRMVALRMGNASAEQLMRGISWIDVPNRTLDVDTAFAIIRALYPSENRPNPTTARDVYVSATWHGDDNVSANAVCRYLAKQGLRLIGDSKDQKGFGTGDRVERIMSSCGAFVAIVPYRREETAVAGEKPYKYFLQEIDFAAEHGLASIVVADPRVRRSDGKDQDWLRMDTNANTVPHGVQSAVDSLWDEWRPPRRPHYVFCAMDLHSEDTRLTGPIRQLIELITSMPTKVGDEVHEGNPDNVNAAVRDAVCDALLVVADLTDDNVNACIEAGMALAVGCNVELLAAGPQRRPPFMLRERNMPTYKDKVAQIGLIHRIARQYRRRIINAELG
jgi:hypothetical protein